MEKLAKRIIIPPSIKILSGFLIIILIGSLLLSLPISNQSGTWLNFINSLFTSTSAVCVTGLTTVDISTTFTLFGKIILLLLIQIGGLGIVAITSLIFLILGKKISLSSRLTIKESLNKETIQGVVGFIKRSIILTLIIEGIGAICLLYSTTTYFGSFGYGLFSAIFMSVSAFCNAGFDILGTEKQQFFSLYNFSNDILTLLPIMLLIIIGGIGFVVLLEGRKNLKTRQHIRVVLWITGILIVGGTIIYLICEWNNPSTLGNMNIGNKILNAFFQSITTRTAGFATIDQGQLTTMGKITTMVLMFIGGSPNSTAGGLKTTTILVILLLLFKKQNSNNDIIFHGKKISNKLTLKAVKILLYTTLALLVGISIIRIIEPTSISAGDIVFECISAISTVGLTTGITPTLAIVSKLVLISLMYIGRVGILTIALLISSRNTDTSLKIEYPNTDIIVG